MSLTTDFSPLSFQDIKDQITTQLKNSDAFFDYEFTGSRLNALIDALAYTVLYGGAYANAAVIESWRQLAVQRPSVVHHAQNNGYVPASKVASNATVEIKLTRQVPSTQPYVIVQRGTKFSGQKGTATYPFVTTEDITILGATPFQEFEQNILISQGRFLSQTVNWTATSRIFIKDVNTDRRFTKVTVNGETWKKADSAPRIHDEDNTKVFYMRETLEGWTEIYFGVSNLVAIDGQQDLSMFVGGKTPQPGDTIVIEYLVTDGEDANDADQFKITSTVSGYSAVVTPTAVDAATGGSPEEDIERIRSVSDKMWQAQGRCVVPSDYENFIMAEYSYFIDAIRCWTQKGVTGYAYIAIKPKNALTLTESQIEQIGNYLKKYNVSTVEPRILKAPVYIFINHTIEIDYDPNLLDITESQLQQNVIVSMENYYKNSINNFGDGYQTSKLLAAIDATHKSILGSSCDIDVVKEFTRDVFWTELTKGSFLSAPTVTRGISAAAFTYDEYDDTVNPPLFVNTHELKVFSSDSHKLVIGPFLPTAVPGGWTACTINPGLVEYTLRDFDEPVDDYYDQNDVDYVAEVKYYELGTCIETDGSGGTTFTQYKFGSAAPMHRWNKTWLVEDSIKYYITVTENSIYPAQGEIIAFDQYLRPEYIKLTPHAILS